MTIQVSNLLDEADLQQAREVGLARLAKARQLKRKQTYGDPGEDQRNYVDLYGALAECAVARWLDLPWNKEIIENLAVKPPDVGECIEVKWCKPLHGHLIAHEGERKDWYYVSVMGEWPQMEIAGWTTGIAIQQPYYRNHPLARSADDYWMPRNELMMTDLMEQMKKSSPTLSRKPSDWSGRPDDNLLESHLYE